jgi:hypothetical protein
VNAPGSVFGEQSVLLDQPHTADVRTLEQSEFYVADAPAILAGDPTIALYVAAILARRLDAANRWLVAVKRQVETGEPPSVIGKAVEKVELERGRLHDRQVGWPGAVENLRSVRADLTIRGCKAGPVADQAAGQGEFPPCRHEGKRLPARPADKVDRADW